MAYFDCSSLVFAQLRLPIHCSPRSDRRKTEKLRFISGRCAPSWIIRIRPGLPERVRMWAHATCRDLRISSLLLSGAESETISEPAGTSTKEERSEWRSAFEATDADVLLPEVGELMYSTVHSMVCGP